MLHTPIPATPTVPKPENIGAAEAMLHTIQPVKWAGNTEAHMSIYGPGPTWVRRMGSLDEFTCKTEPRGSQAQILLYSAAGLVKAKLSE